MRDYLKGKKILVTGAAGFLGRHLVPQLLAAGTNVAAFVRSRKAAQNLPQNVRIIRGDCLDARSVQAAIIDQDIVIHLAGLLFGESWQDYLAANGRAAEILGQAAAGADVKRVVFVSSLAAAGPCGAAPGRSETDLPEPVSAYGWSKLLAENTLAGFLGKKLVIMRPPIIYGSGDRGLLSLFKSCGWGLGIAPRNFPVSIIHADDCARAIELACLPEAHGIYHLNDGVVHDMEEICRAMAKAQGREKIMTFAPPRAVMAISALLSGAGYGLWAGIARRLDKKTPRPPAWNWDKYCESRQKGWLADGRRIMRELSYSPEISLAEGMAEAVAGYRREGLL